jgi:hypothetical protein
MNHYTYRFQSTCPNNKRVIDYVFSLATERMVMVEKIVEECDRLKECFHEKIADTLSKKFGGTQTIEALHHGVHIKTVRGPA